MKRREFLKGTLLFAAVSTVLGKASGILTNAVAATVAVTEGKLGYKKVSPQAKNGKSCSTCKWFKAPTKQCILPAMKNAMKAPDFPTVVEAGYCNMWAKKA